MIEDIEGATSEPTRRGHVAALSAATAALALVLLLTLVVPPSRVDAPPQAASPAPSGSTPSAVRCLRGPSMTGGDLPCP